MKDKLKLVQPFGATVPGLGFQLFISCGTLCCIK